MGRYQKESGQRAVKKKTKSRRLFWLLILLLAVSAVGLFVLFRADSFQVKKVSVSGTVVVREKDIEKIAREKMSGSYFSTIPKTSFFFVPKKKITEALLASSARIKSVSINRQGKDGLHIAVAERKAAHTWCQGASSEADFKECYYIDDEGFAFALAPKFSPGVVFEFFGNAATGTPLVGATVTGSSSVSFVLSFVSFVSSTTPLQLISARALDQGDYELASLEGPIVLISEKESPSAQAGRLNVFFRSDVFSGQGMEGNPAAIEKIDLRFGQKIFYTLKNEAKKELQPENKEPNP